MKDHAFTIFHGINTIYSVSAPLRRCSDSRLFKNVHSLLQNEGSNVKLRSNVCEACRCTRMKNEETSPPFRQGSQEHSVRNVNLSLHLKTVTLSEAFRSRGICRNVQNVPGGRASLQ